jgi:hypothetical protein
MAYAPGMDVKSFGAVGDGTTDDSAAINAALTAAAAAGLSLLVPGGQTFNIKAPLVVPSNSHFIIDGTIFKAALAIGANQFSIIQIIGSNIIIEGKGVLDGNLNNQTITNRAAAGIVTWYGSYVYSAPSLADTFTNVQIRGLTIQNTWNWPVSLSLQHSLVFGCTFNTANSSPQLVNSYDSHFLKCFSLNISDDGLGLYGGNSYCSVTDCTVSNCATGPFCLSDSAATVPNTNCQLNNNIAINCIAAGIFIDGGSGITPPAVATMIQAHGNMVINCPQSIRVLNAVVFSVKNNVCQDTTVDAGGTVALFSGTLQYGECSGNTLSGSAVSGLILVQNDVSTNVAFTIENNKLYNISTSGSSSGIRLECVGSSSYVTMIGNQLFGTIVLPYQDTSATPAAVFSGTNAANNANNQIQQTQGLLIRAAGATTGGINMEPSGSGTMSGDLEIGGGLTVTGNITANAGEIVIGTISTGALTVSGDAIIAGNTATLGFYGVGGVTKQTLTGSRGSATVSVLQQVCALLNALGIATDSTTA